MHKHTKAIAELVDAFKMSVLNYSEFILKDSERANRYYDDFIEALKRIAASGEEGLVALAKLLDGVLLV